jgi:hypothetical protein
VCASVLQISLANSRREEPDQHLILKLKVQFIVNARFESDSPLDTSTLIGDAPLCFSTHNKTDFFRQEHNNSI